MHYLTEYEYDFELLDSDDIDGGLEAILALGLDDLAQSDVPLEDRAFTLFIDANIFPDVAATYYSPPEHGYAEITSIKVRINKKLVELPDILSLDRIETITEHVFIEQRDNPYC